MQQTPRLCAGSATLESLHHVKLSSLHSEVYDVKPTRLDKAPRNGNNSGKAGTLAETFFFDANGVQPSRAQFARSISQSKGAFSTMQPLAIFLSTVSGRTAPKKRGCVFSGQRNSTLRLKEIKISSFAHPSILRELTECPPAHPLHSPRLQCVNFRGGFLSFFRTFLPDVDGISGILLPDVCFSATIPHRKHRKNRGGGIVLGRGFCISRALRRLRLWR